MIVITCRRCGSVNVRKNGHTPSGQQKVHCKDCHAYGTLDTKEQERAHTPATVENCPWNGSPSARLPAPPA